MFEKQQNKMTLKWNNKFRHLGMFFRTWSGLKRPGHHPAGDQLMISRLQLKPSGNIDKFLTSLC